MKPAPKIQFSLVNPTNQKPLDPDSGERVVLASFSITDSIDKEDFNEFSALVEATGAVVADTVTGKSISIIAKSFVGKGKLEAIAKSVKAHDAQLVIFNHHLSPSQERNIEQEVCCRVLDRTGLILDIFSRRATSFEGKLQVELAQLNYFTTKLVRGWTHLERQKGGIGLRGPGETQLESDRRLIRGRIKAVKKRLTKVVSQRHQSRSSRKRSSCFTVALVGYTNAGKSTLFNALTGANIMVADQLFATLDPTVRRLHLPGIANCVISDTVGFIRRLPHDLVAAFRATLTEVAEADLLLHVVDACHPEREAFIDAVNEVLHHISADHVPQLLVYNKIDKDPQYQANVEYDQKKLPCKVSLSATHHDGLDLLQEAIAHRLQGNMLEAELTIPSSSGKLMASLRAQNAITETNLTTRGNWRVQVRMPLLAYKSLRQLLLETHNKEKGVESC